METLTKLLRKAWKAFEGATDKARQLLTWAPKPFLYHDSFPRVWVRLSPCLQPAQKATPSPPPKNNSPSFLTPQKSLGKEIWSSGSEQEGRCSSRGLGGSQVPMGLSLHHRNTIKEGHRSWYLQQLEAFCFSYPCSQRSPSSHQLGESHTCPRGWVKTASSSFVIGFLVGRKSPSDQQRQAQWKAQETNGPITSLISDWVWNVLVWYHNCSQESSPALQDLHPPLKAPLHQQKLWGSKPITSTKVWHKSTERLDNRNSMCVSTLLIYVECWWIRARITSTVKAKGDETRAKPRSVLQTQPGAKFISPMKLRLRKLELPNTRNTQFANSNLFRDGKSRSATAQPHRRLVQALTHSARPLDWPPAQHPLSKDSRQKPKVPHRGCRTIHLHVFKSYLLTTRRMLCWWQMHCPQALATRLFSPWATRTLTLWSSLALLQ